MNAVMVEFPSENARDAIQRLFARELRDGYKLAGCHRYNDGEGRELFRVVRLKHPEREKVIRPMHRQGGRYRLGKPDRPRAGWPLYVPPYPLIESGPVFVVEGETCADALAKLGITATTSGSSSSATDADWTPLQGRSAILWPDKDKAGADYADTVAARLRALGTPCERLDMDALGLHDKGDAVDWLALHPDATAADVLALPFTRAHFPEPPKSAPLVELVRASDIVCRPIRWLWPGWLARGKLHILAGAPGTGKTTIALDLAATVSKGGHWPDRQATAPGNVLIWSGEDDPADTLVPRLKAAGADCDRIRFVGNVSDPDGKRAFDPATDLAALEHAAERIGNVALLVADPIVSAVAGDSHKNTEVRRALQPLVDMAERLDIAVLGITHFTKGSSGRDPTERVTGSLAFAALARVVLVTGQRDEEGDGPPNLLARAKSNIGPHGGGFTYALEQSDAGELPASVIRWGEALDGSARELLGEVEGGDGERSATDEAEDWLADLLAAGPVKATDATRQARQAGISDKALRRAREKLGIKPRKAAMQGGWVWALAVEDAPKVPKMPNKIAGHLREPWASSEPVTCETCRHYLPDPINQEGGMGECGLHPGRYERPFRAHRCDEHETGNAGLAK